MENNGTNIKIINTHEENEINNNKLPRTYKGAFNIKTEITKYNSKIKEKEKEKEKKNKQQLNLNQKDLLCFGKNNYKNEIKENKEIKVTKDQKINQPKQHITHQSIQSAQS